MQPQIEGNGLDELMRRFKDFPRKYSAAVKKTLQASLIILQGSAPGYPSPRSGSRYRRTGTLGGSLGISERGARMGTPEIFEVRKAGGFQEARYGTRLKYAQHVVGENQAWMHQGRWWTVPGDVLRRAMPKIASAFKVLTERLAAYLDRGRGV